MENRSTRQKQHKIPHQLRKQLIRLVQEENKTIKQAHHILGVNYSTAKMIMRKYKDHGRITKFKHEINENDKKSTCLEHQSTTEFKQTQLSKSSSQNQTPLFCQSVLQTVKYYDYNIPIIISPNFYYTGQDCSFSGMEFWNGMSTANYGAYFNSFGTFCL